MGARVARPGRKRINMELREFDIKRLEEIADLDGTTVTNVVRRSIAVFADLRAATRGGGRAFVEHPNQPGSAREITLDVI